MTHTALARKYRPKRFHDLIAQAHVATGLAGAVARNRVAHGYLLTGPRGTGKTTAARILAMALNCEHRGDDGEPCGACDSCGRVWAGSANLDVVEIDAASNRGVDDARELRERAMYAASGPEGFKVYIVDEAHMLTREAWNALLKILEEPPPRVVFVFATTEPQKIANTTSAVLSRLQRFDFRPIGPGAIVDRLRDVAANEGLTVDDDALTLLSRAAKGGMRDALSMFDQVAVFGDGPITAEAVREALGLIGDDRYAELLGIIAERDAGEVFPFVSRLVDMGADLAEFMLGAGEVIRAVLVRRLGGSAEGLTASLREVIERDHGRFAEGDLLRMLKLLEAAEVNIRRSPNARLHVETLLLQWTLLDRTVDLAEVLAALGRGGAAPPPPEPGRRARSGRSESPDPKPPPAVPRDPGRGRRATTEDPAGPPPSGEPPPPRSKPPQSAAEGSLTGAWPVVLDAVGQRSPMTRQLLSQAVPVGVEAGVVTVKVAGGEVPLEGLERSRDAVEEALSGALGEAVRVRLVPAGPTGPLPAAEEPRRQTVAADREDRLRTYRAQDPTLDALADALDLELLE